MEVLIITDNKSLLDLNQPRLNHFWPVFLFYTLLKTPENQGFLVFLWAREWKHWSKICYKTRKMTIVDFRMWCNSRLYESIYT